MILLMSIAIPSPLDGTLVHHCSQVTKQHLDRLPQKLAGAQKHDTMTPAQTQITQRSNHYITCLSYD